MKSKTFTSELDKDLIDLVRNHPLLYDSSHENYKNDVAKQKVWQFIAKTLKRNAHDCKTRWRTVRDSYRRTLNKVKENEKSGYQLPKSKYLSTHLKYLDLSFLDLADRNRISTSEAYHKVIKEEYYMTEDSMTNNTDELIEEPEEKDDNQSVEFVVCDTMLESTEKEKEFNPEGNYIEQTYFRSELGNTSTRCNNAISYNSAQGKGTEETDCGCEGSRILFPKKEKAKKPKEEHPIDLFFKSMAETVKQFPPNLMAETRLKVCQIVTELELQMYNEVQKHTN